MRLRIFASILLTLVCGRWGVSPIGAIQEPESAEWVVLRDLQVVRGEIESIDEDGVHIADQPVVAWDFVLRVHSVSMAKDQIEGYLETIGRSAALIRWRLEIDDAEGAAEESRRLLPRLGDRNSETSAVMCGALMADQLERSDVDAALMSYVQVLQRLNGHPDWRARFPKSIGVPERPGEQLHPRLLPICLGTSSPESRSTQLASVLKSLPLGDQPLSLLVYAAALVDDSSDDPLASKLMTELQRRSHEWSRAFEIEHVAQAPEPVDPITIDHMWDETATWPDEARVVARYWLALRGLKDCGDAFDAAAVRMLSIPAVWGDRFHEVSAAAIVQVATLAAKQGDETTAEKLYNEIRQRYPHTYFGRKVQERSGKNTQTSHR